MNVESFCIKKKSNGSKTELIVQIQLEKSMSYPCNACSLGCLSIYFTFHVFGFGSFNNINLSYGTWEVNLAQLWITQLKVKRLW